MKKRNYKLVVTLLFLGTLTVITQAFAEEKTKEYHESWPVNSVQTLEINNKFGKVNVTNRGGSNVTIDVFVTVEAPDNKKADELLSLINVSFDKIGNTVKAQTHISRDFKSRQKFSIDYEVNTPPDKNLNVTNRYGDTFVNKLYAGGTFLIQYGNFSANELRAPFNASVNISVDYGKVDVESANDLIVTVKYSTVNIGQLNNLDLESKYTVINIDTADSVIAESKYDTFNFGKVGSVSANTKYTRIQMNELLHSMKIDAGYGGIKIGKVDSGFESINITSGYGQISLGLRDAGYLIDAVCDYCGILYPESNFSGDRITENQSRKVKGKVGEGGSGSVNIRSRYGQIRLY